MKYKKLAELYQALEKTSKRLEKTQYLAEFLKKAKKEDLKKIVLMIQGRVFPIWDERKTAVAARLAIKAINIATGKDIPAIEDEWKKTGDLGDVAKNFTKNKSQATLFSQDLTIDKVCKNLQKLPEARGKGAVDRKIKIIAELLTSAKPVEAKYIIRNVLEDLRVGVGDSSLRDAIVWAFLNPQKYDKKKNKIELDDKQREKYNKDVNKVQEAYDVSNDFGTVAVAAKDHTLDKINLNVGTPIKCMLGPKEKDAKSALERVGSPCQAEYKFDGFRLQIHKKGKEIKFYTRNFENVTEQFPEVVEYIKTHVKGDNFILDSEAVGFERKTGKYTPFQHISQRIRRKYDIKKLSEELPVELNVFDVLVYKNKNQIKEPFEKRRALLKKIIKEEKKKIVLAHGKIVKTEDDVIKFFNESISKGNEGLMLKKLDAVYKPGARVGHMVKMKETEEPLDLVITGAEWGEGKRANWLSSFNIACIDNGEFKEMGKVGTGIKEKEEEGLSFKELTNLLKPLITAEKGKTVKVKPKIVVEIMYDEIQKSTTYSSGFALRFPRMIRLRNDRNARDVATLEYIEDYFYKGK